MQGGWEDNCKERNNDSNKNGDKREEGLKGQ